MSGRTREDPIDLTLDDADMPPAPRRREAYPTLKVVEAPTSDAPMGHSDLTSEDIEAPAVPRRDTVPISEYDERPAAPGGDSSLKSERKEVLHEPTHNFAPGAAFFAGWDAAQCDRLSHQDLLVYDEEAARRDPRQAVVGLFSPSGDLRLVKLVRQNQLSVYISEHNLGEQRAAVLPIADGDIDESERLVEEVEIGYERLAPTWDLSDRGGRKTLAQFIDHSAWRSQMKVKGRFRWPFEPKACPETLGFLSRRGGERRGPPQHRADD